MSAPSPVADIRSGETPSGWSAPDSADILDHAGPPRCHHCRLPLPAGAPGGTDRRFCCFGCRIAHELGRPGNLAGEEQPGSTLLLRLGLGIFLGLNIMVFSWASYAEELFGSEGVGAEWASFVSLFDYLLLFLCTALLAVLGAPLLGDALAAAPPAMRPGQPEGPARPLRTLRSVVARLDSTVLILLAVGAAYLLSVIHTLRGQGSLYFDTVAAILVIVTLGRTLEATAKRRATISAMAPLAALPVSATRLEGQRAREVPTDDLAVGDLIRVLPGDTLVVDGTVTSGRSHTSDAILTGESVARAIAPGDPVLAGALNVDGVLTIRTTRVGAMRVLARLERLLDAARSEQPPIQRVADRIAAMFVPLVVLLAALTLIVHGNRGDLADGLFAALAVLLVSCPCALGLAAPLATWHALRRAAELGIVVDSPTTLERAATVDHLFFDKTGTLTESSLEMAGLVAASGVDPSEAIALAAALEATSRHPIAAAFAAEATRRGIAVSAASEAHALPGLGLAGVVRQRQMALGGDALLRLWEIDAGGLAPEPGAQTRSIYLVESEARLLARFDLAEELRTDAVRAADELRRLGIRMTILTGDEETFAERVGERLGVQACGGLLPEDKLTLLRTARGTARGVAVVGDGLNDAPALAAADVGLAVASAVDFTRAAGNVRLLSERLDRVPAFFALARSTVRRVRWNLAWAFGYNTIALSLASSGRLDPVVAAVAMVLSSLTVVGLSRGAGRQSVVAAEPEGGR